MLKKKRRNNKKEQAFERRQADAEEMERRLNERIPIDNIIWRRNGPGWRAVRNKVVPWRDPTREEWLSYSREPIEAARQHLKRVIEIGEGEPNRPRNASTGIDHDANWEMCIVKVVAATEWLDRGDEPHRLKQLRHARNHICHLLDWQEVHEVRTTHGLFVEGSEEPVDTYEDVYWGQISKTDFGHVSEVPISKSPSASAFVNEDMCRYIDEIEQYIFGSVSGCEATETD